MEIVRMTFHQLYAACKAHDMRASIHQWDCGETVTINNGVGELFRISKECGEEPSAVHTAGSWLIINGYIKYSDLPAPKADTD